MAIDFSVLKYSFSQNLYFVYYVLGLPNEPAEPVAYLAINALASTDDDGKVNRMLKTRK